MIWVGGRIVPDDALTVSVLDRTFEHGLGLFETLSTRDGRAPLLDRHLARMSRSAQELGLPLDPADLPDAKAVAALLGAEGEPGDRMLRITLSGGLGDAGGSRLWMRSAPLPPPIRHGGAVVDVGPWRVVRNDPLARHKALNYWSRRLAYESARRLGFDEVLSTTAGWTIWEGSRTNIFVVRGSMLTTPSTEGPIVPGVMRGLVIELANQLPLTIHETEALDLKNLSTADEVFLTNSVRGIIPVARVHESSGGWLGREWPVPGPWTQRLMLLALDWLARQGRDAT
jgi:branched-subunit amino acid aminotransferase/4-amino-4-deoxychorismate lyase